MDEKKSKKIKRRSVTIAVICITIIFLPAIWNFAIGPRDLTGGGIIYEQKVYYMFHTYRCVGWKMGGEKDVKAGKMIRPGLFECYYKGENPSVKNGRKGMFSNVKIKYLGMIKNSHT